MLTKVFFFDPSKATLVEHFKSKNENLAKINILYCFNGNLKQHQLIKILYIEMIYQ